MVLDLWLDKIGISWIVAAPIAAILFGIIYLVDKRWVYPGEAEVAFRDNPEWQKLWRKIE